MPLVLLERTPVVEPPGAHCQYFWLIHQKEGKMKRKNRMMESCQMNEISHHA